MKLSWALEETCKGMGFTRNATDCRFETTLFAQRYRCVEKTSVSRASKAQLIELAAKLADMVTSLECDDDSTFLRGEVETSTPAERLRRFMPGLPPESAWNHDHMAIRLLLPEIGEHVIIAHLCATRPEGDYGARNLYRGAQRAYDLGGLSGFSAVLHPSDGGDLWLRLRWVVSRRGCIRFVKTIPQSKMQLDF